MSKSKSKSKSQQHGEVWERYIRQECRALRKRKISSVAKNWEAPRIPGKFERRETSKCDFSGAVRGGTHVVFEAKASLVTTRFDFGLLTGGQLERLTLNHELGAMAFVYFLDGHRRKWLFHVTEILETVSRESIPLVGKGEGDARMKVRGETWHDAMRRLMGAGVGAWR